MMSLVQEALDGGGRPPRQADSEHRVANLPAIKNELGRYPVRLSEPALQ